VLVPCIFLQMPRRIWINVRRNFFKLGRFKIPRNATMSFTAEQLDDDGNVYSSTFYENVPIRMFLQNGRIISRCVASHKILSEVSIEDFIEFLGIDHLNENAVVIQPNIPSLPLAQ